MGIPVKILKLCEEFSGGEPVLEELENGFKVTLFPKSESALNEVEKQIKPEGQLSVRLGIVEN